MLIMCNRVILLVSVMSDNEQSRLLFLLKQAYVINFENEESDIDEGSGIQNPYVSL